MLDSYELLELSQAREADPQKLVTQSFRVCKLVSETRKYVKIA